MSACCSTCELADRLGVDPLELVVHNPEIPWRMGREGRPVLELRLGQVVRVPGGGEVELVAPVRRLAAASARSRTSGSASLSDFDSLAAQFPDFKAEWSKAEAQFTAEGAVSENVSFAKLQFANAFSDLADPSKGLDAATAAQTAGHFIIAGQTIAGAVGQVTGLIAGAGAAAPLQVAQQFTGLLIGALTTTGVVTAGVGAAVMAGVAALSVIADLFSGGTPAAMLCGVGMTPAPSFAVGCVGVHDHCTDPDPKQCAKAPGSARWRPFPDANNPADAAWFNTSGNFFTWSDADWTPAQVNRGGRAIDYAFVDYRALECGMMYPQAKYAIPSPFLSAFFTAWKANQAYALNRLQPQPDWKVLVQVAKHWNMAHEPGDGVDIGVGSGLWEPGAMSGDPYSGYTVPAACEVGLEPYVMQLVDTATSQLSSQDPQQAAILSSDGLKIHLHTGALKQAVIAPTGPAPDGAAVAAWLTNIANEFAQALAKAQSKPPPPPVAPYVAVAEPAGAQWSNTAPFGNYTDGRPILLSIATVGGVTYDKLQIGTAAPVFVTESPPAPSSSSTGTAVAIGVGIVGLGLTGLWLLLGKPLSIDAIKSGYRHLFRTANA